MMKTYVRLTVMLAVLIVAGCPPPVRSSKGNVSFEIDLSELAAYEALKQDITITAVDVELTRSGYADVNSSLHVSGNTATGTVSDLDAGYWHLHAAVFSGANVVFTGDTDVNIIAGATVETNILFDPVIVEPTTGGVDIQVGINPLPGYKRINQFVSQFMFSAANKRLYIYDSTTATVGVYDSSNMNRIHDLTLDQAPKSVALNFANDGLFLGYQSGQIYFVDFATETVEQVGDALMEVIQISAISDSLILVGGPGNYEVFKTIDVDTEQIVSTSSSSYHFNEVVWNPRAGAFYGLRVGISPGDIHRIPVNTATGAIGTITDSRYHGDYTLGEPIRVIKSGERLAVSSGNMFSSSAIQADDIQYAGNLGQTYTDLTSDDDLGFLYQLTKGLVTDKLLVLNQTNYFVDLAVDLLGEPKRVFADADEVIVFTEDDGEYFVRVFTKEYLGLVSK